MSCNCNPSEGKNPADSHSSMSHKDTESNSRQQVLALRCSAHARQINIPAPRQGGLSASKNRFSQNCNPAQDPHARAPSGLVIVSVNVLACDANDLLQAWSPHASQQRVIPSRPSLSSHP